MLRIIVSLLAVFATCGIAIAASPTVTLPEGTELRLKFAQELSSKTAALDDPVEFVLDDDVKVGDVVVIKAGAKAFGTVSNVKRAGFMGKGGELNVRLETIKAGGTKVRIRGTKGRTGEDKTGSAIALTVLLGPVGLIKHGKEIEVKEGTPITAFVADDIALPPAN